MRLSRRGEGRTPAGRPGPRRRRRLATGGRQKNKRGRDNPTTRLTRKLYTSYKVSMQSTDAKRTMGSYLLLMVMLPLLLVVHLVEGGSSLGRGTAKLRGRDETGVRSEKDFRVS